MRVDAFSFDLPEDLIALRPAVPREAARLLMVGPGGTISHHNVADLPSLLRPKDCMVFNDTRVFRARLRGIRPPRLAHTPQVQVELLLHHRLGANRFEAFARPARRLADGDRMTFPGGLTALVEGRGEMGEVVLSFSQGGEELDRAIAAIGEMPLPPYIAGKRPADVQDDSDYQTVYAKADGSVAAPTAGLHFTPQLLERLKDRGIGRAQLTLHVGAGTFQPVNVEDTAQHRMHHETAILTQGEADRLNATRAAGGRIVAVGTTSMRTLESAADDQGRLHAFSGSTDIFITPGYQFRTAEVLLTNFHLPRSTLFMLVSAFAGLETMRRAYAEAIAHRYRFYSYGDACLLMRAA